jgi:uncharacterized repeat protein (TIGR02543 family)
MKNENSEKFFYLRIFQNFSFWKIYFRFNRKTVLLDSFPMLLVICYLLFVFGCSNFYDVIQKDSASKGTGSFSLVVERGNGRTILPDTPSLDNFAVYTLVFTSLDGMEQTFDKTNGNLSSPINLDIGTYNMEVTAYLDTGKTQPAAIGRLHGITIEAETNVTRGVTLQALIDSGNGSFRWDIDFPSGLSEANITITPLNPAAGTTEQTLYFEGVENKTPQTGKSGSVDLSTGYYRVLFTLVKLGAQRIEWRETLHVYQNLVSVFEFTFTEAHFNNTLYTVTFKYNDGVTNDGEQTSSHGEKVTKPTPTRTGYTFDGWYKDAALNNEWNFDTDTVIGDTPLYAKWTLNQYTVTFNADSGTPAPNRQTVNYGGKVTEPEAMTKTGYTFGGWYKYANFEQLWNFATDIVESEITMYAKWIAIDSKIYLIKVDGTKTEFSTLAEALYEGRDILNLEEFKVSIYDDMHYINSNLGGTIEGRVTIENRGSDTAEINLFEPEYPNNIFSVRYGGVLNLQGKITLKGINNNLTALIEVGADSTLNMYDDVLITGNINIDEPSGGGYGGGVSVSGIFNMHGGEISGNEAYFYGGGVYVEDGGEFNMHDGKISDNEVRLRGGGVNVNATGKFRMYGGKISGNRVTASSGSNNGGGGVYIAEDAFFHKKAGTIYGYGEEFAGVEDNSLWNSDWPSAAHSVYLGNSASATNNKTLWPTDAELFDPEGWDGE